VADERSQRRPSGLRKAQELGVNLIGVHKGVPLSPQPIEQAKRKILGENLLRLHGMDPRSG
jgi:hypothetical protein